MEALEGPILIIHDATELDDNLLTSLADDYFKSGGGIRGGFEPSLVSILG